MCQRNWTKYSASLVQRGSLSFFLSPDLISSLLEAQGAAGINGRPSFSLQITLLMLSMKVSFRLSYRACEGMARSLLEPHGVKVPSYVTLCRRIKDLDGQLPALSDGKAETILVDSSGFKVLGEGEWKAKMHGRSYRRSWVKAHIAVDSQSNEIVDLILSPNNVSDAQVGRNLLTRTSSRTKYILGDGAYDCERFRQIAYEKGIKDLVPPPTHAILRDEPHLERRNDALRIICGLGGDKVARRIWSKLTGYCHRVKVESAFSRLKRLFGERLFSRRFDAMQVELWLKARLSNLWLKWVGSKGF